MPTLQMGLEALLIAAETHRLSTAAGTTAEDGFLPQVSLVSSLAAAPMISDVQRC